MAERISPLLLILGDAYLRRKKVEAALSRLVPEDKRAFNIIRFDLKQFGITELIRQARSFPMMEGNQVFVIDRPGEFKKDQTELLETYLASPAAWSYFLIEADDLREDHLLMKLITKYGKRIVCETSEQASALGLIHQKLKDENRSMTKDAWQLLQEKTGGNLTLLDACIDKLILYSEPKMPLDAAAVAKFADEFLVYDPFDLTEAISEKNARRALEIFRVIYRLSGSAIETIGLINWQLKRIWQAKMLFAQGGEALVMKKVRVSSYRLPTLMRQVGRFAQAELKKAFRELFDLDRKLKTGACEERVAMEAMIARLAS